MLVLEDVTPENYAEALMVATDPQHLVAPVLVSLADAYVWKSRPRVARERGRLVGFVLVYPFEWQGRPASNIVRFLVDQRHQGRGVGRELMEATLAWLRTESPAPSRFRITTRVENHRAQRLFRSCGFAGDTVVDGEVVLWQEA